VFSLTVSLRLYSQWHLSSHFLCKTQWGSPRFRSIYAAELYLCINLASVHWQSGHVHVWNSRHLLRPDSAPVFAVGWFQEFIRNYTSAHKEGIRQFECMYISCKIWVYSRNGYENMLLPAYEAEQSVESQRTMWKKIFGFEKAEKETKANVHSLPEIRLPFKLLNCFASLNTETIIWTLPLSTCLTCYL
jgi:hypothetical protein